MSDVFSHFLKFEIANDLLDMKIKNNLFLFLFLGVFIGCYANPLLVISFL